MRRKLISLYLWKSWYRFFFFLIKKENHGIDLPPFYGLFTPRGSPSKKFACVMQKERKISSGQEAYEADTIFIYFDWDSSCATQYTQISSIFRIEDIFLKL